MKPETFYQILLCLICSCTLIDAWPIMRSQKLEKVARKIHPKMNEIYNYNHDENNYRNNDYENRNYQTNLDDFNDDKTENNYERNKFIEREYDIIDESSENESEVIDNNHYVDDNKDESNNYSDTISDQNLKDWFEPEAELIDSSKVAKDLRNVRLMRLSY